MKHLHLSILALCGALLFCSLSVDAKRVLKVLAIGNSFSVDAIEQNLYELAAAQGDSLVIGNSYIGGCSIDRHWANAQSQKAEYSYRKIVGGKKMTQENTCLNDIIHDEPWDIITLQQASPLSGIFNSYNHLPDLMKYVKNASVNRRFVFAFHLTWAYAQNSTHPGFANYDRNQTQMYDSICRAVRLAVKKNHIKRVIPSGIAIQKARAVVGDILCRDGYHLSYSLGRYIAACTWCEFLTGKSVVGNTYHPRSITDKEAEIAQRAAHEALEQVEK